MDSRFTVAPELLEKKYSRRGKINRWINKKIIEGRVYIILIIRFVVLKYFNLFIEMLIMHTNVSC